MNSLVVLEQMVMIFILILTGFVLYKKKIISDGASKDLSALVVNVCSPGLIIVSMFNDLSQIPRENVIFVGIIGVIFYLLLIFFGYFLVWVLKVPGHLKNAYVLMTVFGNTGFIGIPVALAIIGPESMVYVIVFNFLFNLTIFTFGIMLLKKDTPGKKQSWKDYLSPGLIACIAAFGIYWFQIQLPEEIETLAGYYGNACTLLSMIVIGISLAGMKAKDTLKKTASCFCLYPVYRSSHTAGSGPSACTARSVDKSSSDPDGCSSGRKFFGYALRTVRKRSQAHCRGDRSDYDLIGIYHYSDFYAGIIVGSFCPKRI